MEKAGNGEERRHPGYLLFCVKPNIVLFITAYAKNEKDNLSNDDKKKIRQIVAEFQSK